MSKEQIGAAGTNDRSREASRWFVEHEADHGISPTVWQNWDQWTADPDNCSEFDAIVRLQREARLLPRPPLPTEDELLADPLEAQNAQASIGEQVELNAPTNETRSRGRWFPMAIAAAVTALTLCTAILWLALLHTPSSYLSDPGQVYVTAPGEQRELALEDGSSVALAGDTEIVVRQSADRRVIVLYRGEALFRVEHDAERPFIVLAAGGKITALGTAFNVRLYSNRVQVAVTEGSVEVAPRNAQLENVPVEDLLMRETPQWIPVRLAHGQEMSYDTKGEASAPKSTDPRVTTAWTQGALIYRGRPLHEVIEDVQRYSAREIVFDPAARELLYTGTIVQRSLDEWIHRLPEIFPVEIVESESDRIVIRSRSVQQPARGPNVAVRR